MEVYGIPSPDTRDPLKRALDRIDLCTLAIQETHFEVEPPENPEHKADLLIAVEALALEAMDLLNTTRIYVWGNADDVVDDEE